MIKYVLKKKQEEVSIESFYNIIESFKINRKTAAALMGMSKQTLQKSEQRGTIALRYYIALKSGLIAHFAQEALENINKLNNL